ncbi:mitochondrial carrier domain-containing protein [Dunaliella salina]|uniref:Mitochondrial carrier domain-containing protein n=1 Tax=Dunaliella salina TaxID=3046 RepID=A0ABQ7GN21_DUNSA|nr:mitochondrial carrier domain-containing protein [Dunaliella salina]|eukprot:KAF5835972.1 mitochondrial carrier domain-containing protein [Dunaliella salina]
MNTWGALRSGLGIDVTASATTGGEGGSQTAGQQGPGARVPAFTVVRSLPRLWTGFGATIARDVPFSALYWGLLEPIRAALLAYSSAAPNSSSTISTTSSPVQGAGDVYHASASTNTCDGTSTSPHRRGDIKAWSNSDAQEWLLSDAAAGSMAPLAPCTLGGGSAIRSEVNHRHSRGDGNVCEAQLSSSRVGGGRQQSHLEGGYPGNGRDASAVSSSSSSMPACQARHGQPGPSSSSQLVWVNLTAGSAAGAAAAAATTPFDVVKTRIQTATRSAEGDVKAVVSPLNVMKQVYNEGGVAGLFVGLGPRAVRCAPACAIVVACYELFKSWL